MNDFTYSKPRYIFPHCELCIHFPLDDEFEPCKSCAYDGPHDRFWLNEDVWPARCDECESAGTEECKGCAVTYHLCNLRDKIRPESFEYFEKSRYAKEKNCRTWNES